MESKAVFESAFPYGEDILSLPVADREAAFDWYGRRFAMVETEPCSVQSALSAIAASTRAARRAGT